MICDKAGQFKGCIGCSGAVAHDKNGGSCVDEVYVCRRVEDEKADVLVMCIPVKDDA